LLTIHDLLKLIIQLLSTKHATKWVAEYGNEIGVDGKRLAVAETVLENMATVVAMMAKEKKRPTIKLQVLFWPVTDIILKPNPITYLPRIDS
jgi:acetyl esterase/lipase